MARVVGNQPVPFARQSRVREMIAIVTPFPVVADRTHEPTGHIGPYRDHHAARRTFDVRRHQTNPASTAINFALASTMLAPVAVMILS
jgi:hypothetical protein